MAWFDVCNTGDLQEDAGVCALVAGLQIALFYIPQDETVYALHNYDPFGKANVLSRGLTGDIAGQPVVASPLYKQHFNLETGTCLEDEAVSVPAYPVRIVDSRVQIGIDL